ncbi:GLPGLI family protein [Chryseobacterium ginsenosidimutans]|uniref:GLPGLI family protein n=1 Tax=Chryseobacterium ginsenosidimutans TaxID=687846 RepID=UPI002781EB3F|nr:GLPGLI family protein [Chryseobacterium ginsenosidimutans]MDQ0594458.1 GLPGLI family protein [Chryseobacterium ginsenosidimutans]
MKKNAIFKSSLFFIFIILFNNVHSQNKLFKYDLEYRPNPLKDSTILEKTFLDVNEGKLSIFRTDQERRTDSLKALNLLGLGKKIRFEEQFYIVKKLSENEIQKSIQTIYSEIFSIKINEKLDWEILPEKSKIATFDVQKAKVTYGGRSWTAWFTTEIPIQDGPYIFKGLPGLIVKISDEQNDYSFSLTEIKNGNEKVYYRNKGLELTWEQFKKLSENYYSDPLARMKSMGLPLRVDDGKGNAVVPDMKVQSDKMKRIIRDNNNPIELNHKIDYK